MLAGPFAGKSQNGFEAADQFDFELILLREQADFLDRYAECEDTVIRRDRRRAGDQSEPLLRRSPKEFDPFFHDPSIKFPYAAVESILLIGAASASSPRDSPERTLIPRSNPARSVSLTDPGRCRRRRTARDRYAHDASNRSLDRTRH